MPDLNPLLEAYLATLSAPIKPGAVHRLARDIEYDVRLFEYVAASDFAGELFKRSYMIARGDLEARNLGLGRHIADALKRAFERTGLKPLTGMIVSFLTMSSLVGFYAGMRESATIEDAVRRGVRVLLYSAQPEDTVFLVDGLEAVGDSDLVLLLDDKGLTRRRITINNLTLGDLYEVLSTIDTGFYLNLRKLSKIFELRDIIRGAPNIIGGIVEAYLKLADEIGILDMKAILASKNPIAELAHLDARIADRRKCNRLLGAVLAAAAIANYEGPLRLPMQ